MLLAFDVNLLAVLVAVIIDMIIGSLWYSPILFLKPWAKRIGADLNKKISDEQKKQMMRAMGVSSMCALVMAYVFAVLLKTFGIVLLQDALLFAAILWLGLMFAPHMVGYSYENRSHVIGIIMMSYKLLSLLAMAALFVLWK